MSRWPAEDEPPQRFFFGHDPAPGSEEWPEWPPPSPTRPQNFPDCVQSRQTPITGVEVGAGPVTVCHLGVAALQAGKKLTRDAKASRFTGPDAAGNARLGRPMRAPWKLEGTA